MPQLTEEQSTLEGTVSSIIFQNEENGYTILRLDVKGEEMTVVGPMPGVSPGEYLAVKGRWVRHATYGVQLRAETVERQARNRAAQMYHRVNGLIADLAARMEGSKAEMTTAAEALGQALDQLQSALDGGQDVLTEGAATLRALEPEHPAEEETK